MPCPRVCTDSGTCLMLQTHLWMWPSARASRVWASLQAGERTERMRSPWIRKGKARPSHLLLQNSFWADRPALGFTTTSLQSSCMWTCWNHLSILINKLGQVEPLLCVEKCISQMPIFSVIKMRECCTWICHGDNSWCFKHTHTHAHTEK